MIDGLISSFLSLFFALVPIASSPTPSVTPANNTTAVLFAGDVMLGRSVMGAALDAKDSLYPFRHTSEFLKDADLTYVNLENPITSDCKPHKGGFTFCTTPEIAQGLRFSGVDIVSLANNHSGNYGNEGLTETKKYLDEMGIKWVDGTNLEIIENKGTKYGFLGFDYVYKTLKEGDLELIKKSDPQVDVLIVLPHWGEEYKAMANSFQKETAQKMIANGADLIVGAHPHWVQNYEEIDGKPVYYSLGNFVFDQMWSEETKKGQLVKITFERNVIINKEEFKTYISPIGQPKLIN